MKDIRKSIEKYLERLKNGDKCFTEFFNLSYSYVQHAAHRFLSDKNYEKDVIENTYESLLRSISAYDKNKNGYAWLYTIAKNEAFKINQTQNSKRDKEITLEWLSQKAAERKDEIQAVEDKYDVEMALDTLDDDERLLVELRIYEHKTYEQMTAELGIPTATIYQRLKKIYKKLLEILK